MVQLTKIEALQRTKRMLSREWNLDSEPTSDMDLRKAPPNGLGKNDSLIRALETPIEAIDFLDVKAAVIGSNLIDAKTVATLRNAIWEGISDAHKG